MHPSAEEDKIRSDSIRFDLYLNHRDRKQTTQKKRGTETATVSSVWDETFRFLSHMVSIETNFKPFSFPFLEIRVRTCIVYIHGQASCDFFFLFFPFIVCERIRALSRVSVVLQIVQLVGEMTALGIAPPMLLTYPALRNIRPRHFRYLKGRKSLVNFNALSFGDKKIFYLLKGNLLFRCAIGFWGWSNRFRVMYYGLLQIQREAISSRFSREIYVSATNRSPPFLLRIIDHTAATTLTTAGIADVYYSANKKKEVAGFRLRAPAQEHL